MIRGKRVVIRAVREGDLSNLFSLHNDVSLRGAEPSLGLISAVEFQKVYREDGFLGKNKGQLVVADHDDRIIGYVSYFTVGLIDGFELAYCLFDVAARGTGVMTEALRLVITHLFDSHKINRLQIATLPSNESSRRLALRCGFRLEGTLRGSYFHRGKNEDVLLFSLLRAEHEASQLG